MAQESGYKVGDCDGGDVGGGGGGMRRLAAAGGGGEQEMAVECHLRLFIGDKQFLLLFSAFFSSLLSLPLADAGIATETASSSSSFFAFLASF